MTPPAIPALPIPADAKLAWWAQSLGDGAPGIALKHIARARAGDAGWKPVHHLASAMTHAPVNAHPDTASLFQGAPAVAYALHTADHPAYRAALTTLDKAIATMIRHRLDAAHQRIDDGQRPQAREYDLISGLTGLGAYLLHRGRDGDLLRDVLAYLVRLTSPVPVDGRGLPGWWATGSPDRRVSSRWNAGHAGFGMAHGIAGPLALLAITMRQGIVVARQADALHTVVAWLDQWRTSQGKTAWWPEVIDHDEARAGSVTHPGPHRPSWCSGTPGIARAQHLAALAVGDQQRARGAARALAGCLTDERQLAHLTDAGLCHGWAGLLLTARRTAADTDTDELAAAVSAAETRMHSHLHDQGQPAGEGLLDGAAGIALANAAMDATAVPALPGWERCLLIG
ncbi:MULTISPECIES: lanthionine synthetase C family protein [unclassified Pseudofrankia]|uniref:lanthionine synthetase C family protein n=1 Tax=unclassified Pseudofrankia TaxID=2994372 RepID=UPI0008DA7ECD|nr:MULTISPECIES: lanthionine synthetase C family protein [unclassified Pseudofrankia]MDT3443609.1 lanthionine synthetase C family protein [Pseudofrankia sp. BMG5.37]OHV43934.1 lanthionine synthetase C family protein [Pseudofrankia sp. BMG5.36]